MKILFHFEAEKEFLDAINYYNERGLGLKFDKVWGGLK